MEAAPEVVSEKSVAPAIAATLSFRILASWDPLMRIPVSGRECSPCCSPPARLDRPGS